MTDKACGICVKRHLVPANGLLECRAAPPRQDVARYAQFPTVQPDHYCHDGFVRDVVAAKARDAAVSDAAKLDGLVAETAARAAAQPELPLNEPEAEPTPAPSRARRARGAAKA